MATMKTTTAKLMEKAEWAAVEAEVKADAARAWATRMRAKAAALRG